jgi:hypothetical protein
MGAHPAAPAHQPDQTVIQEARDAGELDEFPGMPDTNGEIFTVNWSRCSHPPTYESPG